MRAIESEKERERERAHLDPGLVEGLGDLVEAGLQSRHVSVQLATDGQHGQLLMGDLALCAEVGRSFGGQRVHRSRQASGKLGELYILQLARLHGLYDVFRIPLVASSIPSSKQETITISP